ncbi:hypothetical protein Pint_14364 [Pistacia integerrima]|uniref:Uncharacterized protein n=1 Tax=Pistacia integerrima TaxID=434235 RepID=A0ACC0Y6U7_9ROSI|nr:hypothetical protein Pint_14364 [Pistacia integerrima]
MQMNRNSKTSASNDESVRLAVAISLLRSKLRLSQNQSTQPSSESDALRWKRKMTERKQELIRLREDLREAEDSSHCDLFPQSASCKCYFFDRLGKLSPKIDGDASYSTTVAVVVKVFVHFALRLKERRRRTGDSNQRRRLQAYYVQVKVTMLDFAFLIAELSYEDQVEQLRASVDFLVELCDTVSPAKEGNFANWSHQTLDFILGADSESLHIDVDSQFCIQHLILKLASEAYIGQCVIFSVSQRISVVAESLLFSYPFDVAFPSGRIQLIEFLISDYLLTWSNSEFFDKMLFEEWVKSVLQARKVADLLESRNGLYVLYMDRVTGLVAKQVGQVSSLHKLNPDLLGKLLFLISSLHLFFFSSAL